MLRLWRRGIRRGVDVMRLLLVSICALAACAQVPQEIAAPALRCDDPHTREQAAAAVAACDREIEAAADAPLAERVRLQYRRGVALTNVRDLPAAIEALTVVVSLDPLHASAYRLRGYVYWRQRDFDAAMADTEAALRIDPNLAMAYYSRGLIYSMRGEGLEAAIVEVTRAHELEPDNPVFLTTRCRMRGAAAVDLPLALADCDRALALRPRHADTHDYRGRVLLQFSRFEDAQREFETALELDSSLASARYGRGLALTGRGLSAEGQADMDAALAAEADVAQLFVTPRRIYEAS